MGYVAKPPIQYGHTDSLKDEVKNIEKQVGRGGGGGGRRMGSDLLCSLAPNPEKAYKHGL